MDEEEKRELLANIRLRGYKLECDETGWFFTALDAVTPHMIAFYSDDEEHAILSMRECTKR